MSRKLQYALAAAVIVGCSLSLAWWQSRELEKPSAPVPQQAAATAATIESSGRILGIAIGMQISEARAKLDPLRVPSASAPDAKEQAGKRIYWKLNGTEYDWIMAWANSKGEITRIRATLRPDNPKPFVEIGDLARAAVNTPEKAMWNVTRAGEPAVRLIAQGKDYRAATFYMFALNLEMR